MSKQKSTVQWSYRFAFALLVGMVFAGCPSSPNQADKAIEIDLPRFVVDLREDDHALGGENPLVTIVFFSDYACAPCGRNWLVMKNLAEDYGEDIRIVYRSYTVAGHVHGDQAAEAAFAAGEQGKFWDMHWRLFEDTDEFSRPSLRAHASAIGLDVPKFFDDLDTGTFAGQRMRDRRQATELGIKALPVVFINGLFKMGPSPDEGAWHALIDEEIKRSRELMQEGVARADVYAAYQKNAKRGLVTESNDAQQLRDKRLADKAADEAIARSQLNSPDETKRYAVPTEGAASVGPDDAPVVVVEFVDFACPYCRTTFDDVVPRIRQAYPERVRFVILHLPLEIHPVAPGAAKAAIAAGRQKKFWEFHDRLFQTQGGLGRQTFVKIARDLGLDVDTFTADLDKPDLQAQLDADLALAHELGVRGTPGFFINGRYKHGAHDFGTYQSMIDEELALADKAEKAGTPREQIHSHLMQDALPREQFPNPKPQSQGGGGDG
jgi:protein-disulfide isomerase